jgi:ribonuclease D
LRDLQENTVYVWIDNSVALADLLAGQSQTTLALDTEFVRVDTFYPKLALVQVNLAGTAALIDPLALSGLGALGPRLAAAGTLTVMHSASEDLEAFGTVGVDVAALFDTQIAAALCGLGPGLSYQKLVAQLTGVDLPKAETRSDWLQRPLSPQQLEYAAQDVVHLPALHKELAARLDRLERTQWHAEDCARLLERVRSREGDPQPQRAIKSAADWPLQQQALLRRLLLWRDATARSADKPRPWLLDDARAAEFVLNPPQSAEELYERSKGLRALRGALRTSLFEEIRRPLEAHELDIAPIPPMPTPKEKRALTAMKDAVNRIAAELELPEGLLCARKHLEALLFDKVWPAALEGWRKPLLHDALLNALAE